MFKNAEQIEIKMDKDIARKLFDELKMHQGIIKPEVIFFDILENAQIERSSKFYEDLPFKEQTLNEPSQERYSILSLRKVIRNENAKKNKITGVKKLFSKTLELARIYSSTDLIRKIREEGDLVDLMIKSEKNGNPYSLLGKIEDVDWSNDSGILYRKISPVLVIPEFVNKSEIESWENKNTAYEKEILFFKKRISKEKYLTQGKTEMEKCELYKQGKAFDDDTGDYPIVLCDIERGKCPYNNEGPEKKCLDGKSRIECKTNGIALSDIEEFVRDNLVHSVMGDII